MLSLEPPPCKTVCKRRFLDFYLSVVFFVITSFVRSLYNTFLLWSFVSFYYFLYQNNYHIWHYFTYSSFVRATYAIISIITKRAVIQIDKLLCVKLLNFQKILVILVLSSYISDELSAVRYSNHYPELFTE